MIAIESSLVEVFAVLKDSLDVDLKLVVFVLGEQGSGIGVSGYADDREAFRAVMDVMGAHAVGQMRRERERVSEHRSTRPQG